MPNWKEAQEWEAQWHGQCLNTYGEEEKQLLYANRMGLKRFHDGKSPYNFDLSGASVVDIGGGPSSLLLKCVNFSHGAVVDPLLMPDWVLGRYETAQVRVYSCMAEKVLSVLDVAWDEVWVYNVLQHTEDPQLVIENARRLGKLIRIFEWVDTVVNIGHPHALSSGVLNEWLGGEGKVEQLKGQANCFGWCYFGIFPT